jgi:hypothetical protein
MNRKGHEDVKFFIGAEVEQTPAFGANTLFVIGVQPNGDIMHHVQTHPIRIEHIYFGANMSFPNPATNDFHTWNSWEDMICPFLEAGMWCTLDLDVKSVEGLAESRMIEYHHFIPMISVKLPYIKQLGYNATIKLDDRDFAATNPGVWCHSLHALQRRSVFTDWSEYTQDEVIK